MWEFIIVMLISCLMGMGVGGESASFLEGGGPQRISFNLRKTMLVVEGVFYG